jgi:hypothetical protein
MEEREFIIQELERLVEKFPQIRVRYEFNNLANANFIEISPEEIYERDEDFISWDLNFDSKFHELFGYEGLCILPDDGFDAIDNAELTLCGAEYVEQPRKTPEVVEPKPKRTGKRKEVAV